MSLEPGQSRELCKAIGEAYDLDGLTVMLFEDLQRKLSDIILDGPFPLRVAAVVAAAEGQGWTAELVRAAHERYPDASRLRLFYQTFRAVSAASDEDPYDAYVLRANRLFLNRRKLRGALKALASPQGTSVMVIDGPPSSGKTYTVKLIQHVADHPRAGGFAVHSFDLDDPDAPGPGDLSYDIVQRIGGDLNSMPAQGPGSAERWAMRLAVWVANQVASLETRRYLIFDGFSKAQVPQATLEMITKLTLLADNDFKHVLRIVLVSYDKPLHPQINDYAQRDSATHFDTADAVEFVMNIARCRGLQVDVDAVTQAIQNTWEAYPKGTPDRGQKIARALAELIEIIL